MKLSTFFSAFALMLSAGPLASQDSSSGFTSETFDVGVVVSDVDKAVKFYTEAVGFKEVKGFTVPATWTKDVGLTDGQKLDIRVLVLGDSPSATKLKLMNVPGSKTKKGDNQHVPSQYGMRYTTIHVNDIDEALARLKKAGVKPDSVGGAVELPDGFPKGVFLTLVRDPDGNMVELVGPRKK